MTRDERVMRNPETYSALRFQGYDAPRAAAITESVANDTRPPSGPSRYEVWSRTALDRQARVLKIEGHPEMTRPELIAALRG